ncbi:MAG TPA: gamma-glutamyl-gamma-aminobutyrate hydrolase family protein [Solirubrobacteraceae bacterium]|nr:gamma-glutamyl-gamma-aminobutyrate hydrolase family protein [Solirubrobacteraceae bacterium]
MSRPPLIGVSASVHDFGDYGGVGVHRPIFDAGGQPMALPQLVDAIGPALDAVDAIVLAPGRDIEPHRYGQEPHALLAATEPQRDAFELALVLADALGTTSIEVSSFHHQAIDRVGEGLVVVARSCGDGLPEAVEMPGRPLLAVQWELQEDWRVDPRFAAVFDWFVRTASDFGDPHDTYGGRSPKSVARP